MSVNSLKEFPDQIIASFCSKKLRMQQEKSRQDQFRARCLGPNDKTKDNWKMTKTKTN